MNASPGATTADVVVLGAGMAGLVAAVRLAEAGLRVVTVAKGYGSLRLAPATIDILGYGPEPVEGFTAFKERRNPDWVPEDLRTEGRL